MRTSPSILATWLTLAAAIAVAAADDAAPAADDAAPAADDAAPAAGSGTPPAKNAEGSAAPIRFATVDLVLDPGAETVAAWQCELRFDPETVAVVGIESAGAGFSTETPPYYDRRGLGAGRLIIGAFSTEHTDLRPGRTPVARLHLQLKGAADPDIGVAVQAAARPGGKKVLADASVKLSSNDPGQ